MYNNRRCARRSKREQQASVQEMTPLKLPSIRSAKPKSSDTPSAAIAVAIDSLNCRIAVVDDRGRVRSERDHSYTRTALHRIGADIAALINDSASLAQAEGLHVKAVGLSVNGYVASDGRVTIARRLGSPTGALSLNNAALKEAVESELSLQSTKSTHARLAITSRAAACVLAESWIGAASGESNVAFFSIADEIEVGLLVDGRVIRGAAGRAGAAGWFALSETFREEFVEAGCLNVEGAQRAIVRRTIESWHDAGSSVMSRLSVSHASEITAEMVIRAARGGDPLAGKVIGEMTAWIGRGLADVISLLNPRVVVVGGSLGLALRPFVGDLRKEARRWAEPGSARQCRIVPSRLGEKAALIGAARLALK